MKYYYTSSVCRGEGDTISGAIMAEVCPIIMSRGSSARVQELYELLKGRNVPDEYISCIRILYNV